MKCMMGLHDWDGCVCRRCGKQRDRDHDRDGCRCRKCGKIEHRFETVTSEFIHGPGCCWDLSEPCVGPHCGTPCDSWFPGRAGERRETLRCRFCGAEALRTETVEYRTERRP